MTTIRTLHDVCQHFGTTHDTTESLSRRIYQNTECGAWATVEARSVGKRQQLWRARIGDSIIGPRVLHAGPAHGQQLSTRDLPEPVRQWLQLSPMGTIEGMTWAEVERLQPEAANEHDATDGQIVCVTRDRKRNQLILTFVMTFPIVRPAFVCGSIVEGSDAEVGPVTVALPCQPADLNAAVESVNAEACMLWDQANESEA
jgi:hypothetical protein